MTAGHYRLCCRIRAYLPREDIADLIDGDHAAGLPGPSDEQVPAFPVEIGQSLPVAAAVGRSSDRGHFLEPRPQPFAIDTQAAGGVHCHSLRGA
jgi:hypothetical protein